MPAPGLICAFEACRRPVTEGKVVEVRQVGEAEVAYGVESRALEDGLEYPLVHRFHRPCWFAKVKRGRILAARAADPSGHPGDAADWREPATCDVEDLPGVFGRDYREAGTAAD